MATRLLLVTLLLVVTDYTVANAATQLYDQLNQLCNGQIDNHYSPTSSSPPPINQGPPGKKGPKGDKGESSTFYVNEEKNRRFASKIATLHKQLTTVQDENEVLSTKLEKTEQLLNSTEEKLSIENRHLQIQLNETEKKFKNENEVLSTKLEKTEQLLNSTEQKLSNENEVLSTKLEKTEQLLNSTEEKLAIENQHLQLQLNETEKKFKNENEVLSTKLEKTEQLLNSTEQKLATVEKLFEEYQRTTESRFSELTERLGLIGVRSCQDVPAFYGTTNNGTYLIQPNPWVPSVNVTCYFNESTGEIIRLASCAEIARIQGTTSDGPYLIQPDSSLPPFDVECSFNGNTATTTIHHNSEEEIEVSNCDPKKCYGRNIVYEATIPQIRALISLDGKCRQYIKYRCHNSLMFHNGANKAGWETWDGTMRHYWGGSGGRDGYCACGVTGTCADTNYKCNCDKNDQVWREDEGFLDQEEDLPATKIYFGDANTNEYGHHTLGSLQCQQSL